MFPHTPLRGVLLFPYTQKPSWAPPTYDPTSCLGPQGHLANQADHVAQVMAMFRKLHYLGHSPHGLFFFLITHLWGEVCCHCVFWRWNSGY